MTEDLGRGENGIENELNVTQDAGQLSTGQASASEAAPAAGSAPNPAATQIAQAAPQTLSLSAANVGQVIQTQPGQTIEVEFDPAQVQLSLDGDDLIFTFPDGGTLVLQGFASTADAEFILQDGQILAGDIVVASLRGEAGELPFETAAGPGGEGSGTNYSDDLGEGGVGLDRTPGGDDMLLAFDVPNPEPGGAPITGPDFDFSGFDLVPLEEGGLVGSLDAGLISALQGAFPGWAPGSSLPFGDGSGSYQRVGNGQGEGLTVISGSFGVDFQTSTPSDTPVFFSTTPDDLAGLTSQGEAIVVEVTPTGIFGYVPGVDGGADRPVFAAILEQTEANGNSFTYSYSFVLLDSLDHDLSSPLGLPFEITASSTNNGSATAGFTVTINDDVPELAGEPIVTHIDEADLVADPDGGEGSEGEGPQFVTSDFELVDVVGQIFGLNPPTVVPEEENNGQPPSQFPPIQSDGFRDPVGFSSGNFAFQYGADGPLGGANGQPVPFFNSVNASLTVSATSENGSDGPQYVFANDAGAGEGEGETVLTSQGEPVSLQQATVILDGQAFTVFLGHTGAPLDSEGGEQGGMFQPVFMIVLNNQTGEFEMLVFQPLDHPAGLEVPEGIGLLDQFRFDLSVSITDFDGSVSAEQIASIFVNDDGPSGNPTIIKSLGENELGDGGSAVVSGCLGENGADFGADGPAAGGGFSWTARPNGNPLIVVRTQVDGQINDPGEGPLQLSSQGELVSFVFSDDDPGLITGLSADGREVFTLSLNPETGAYVFELKEPLDHAGQGQWDSADQIFLQIRYTLTDADGDSVSDNILSIRIEDDKPTMAKCVKAGKVLESDLVDSEASGVEGSFQFDYGADGPAAEAPVDLQLRVTGENGFDTAYVGNGETMPGLTSHGEEIVLQVIQGENGETVLRGLVGGDEGRVAFEARVDDDSGDFSFDFFLPLDHPLQGQVPDSIGANDPLVFHLKASITDFDGDTVSGVARVSYKDDGPSLVGESPRVSMVEPAVGEGSSVTRKGDFDFDFGADGPKGGDFNQAVTVSLGVRSVGEGPNAAYGFAGDSGPVLHSQGEPVALVGPEIEGGYTLLRGVTNGGDTTVFEIRINNETGEFHVEIFEPLDHPRNEDGEGSVIGADDRFVFDLNVTIEDFDGDTASQVARIVVRDDGPSLEAPDPLHIDEGALVDDAVEARVEGSFNFDFGNDGPRANDPDNSNAYDQIRSVALSLTVQTSSGAILGFANTAEGDQGVLTSQGEEITLLQRFEQASGSDAPALMVLIGHTGDENEPVFRIELNRDTGDFEVTLFKPLDHPDGALDADTLTFLLEAAITDFDGDVERDTAEIVVTDHGPSIEMQVDPYHLAEADLADGNLVQRGSFDFDFGADGPKNGDFLEAVVLSLKVSADGEGVEPTAFRFANQPGDGPVLTAGGQEVALVERVNQNGELVIAGRTGPGAENLVFRIIVNPETGDYTIQLFQPLDHQRPDGEGGAITGLEDIFRFELSATITDFDGTTVTAERTIIVKDDGPVQRIVNHDLTSEQALLGDGDTLTGELDGIFGADGPAEGGGYAWSANAAGEPVLVIRANDGEGPVTTDNPEVETLTSAGEEVIISFEGDDQTTIVGRTESGELVFTLTLDPVSGEYSFELHRQLDHQNPNQAEGENDTLWFNFRFTTTDADGDSVTNNQLRIEIADSVPVVGDVSVCLEEKGWTQGNLLGAESTDLGLDTIGGTLHQLIANGVTYTLNGDGDAMEGSDGSTVALHNGVAKIPTEHGTIWVQVVENEDSSLALGQFTYKADLVDHHALAGAVAAGEDGLSGDLSVNVYRNGEKLDGGLVSKDPNGDGSYWSVGSDAADGSVGGEVTYAPDGASPEQSLEYMEIKGEGLYTKAEIEIGAFYTSEPFGDYAAETLTWQAYDAHGNLVGEGEITADSLDGLKTLTITLDDTGGQPFQSIHLTPSDNGGQGHANSDFGLVSAKFYENVDKLEEDIGFVYKDGDGDTDGGKLTVGIKDDQPSIVKVIPVNLLAFENRIDGLGSKDGNWQGLGIDPKAAGYVKVDFGKDGPGGGEPLRFDMDSLPEVTVGGEAVTYQLSDNGTTLTAYAGDTKVFTVTISDTSKLEKLLTGGANFKYEFELHHGIDHGDSGLSDAIKALNFGIVATDGDGSQTQGQFTVKVVDDAPEAEDVQISCVKEGGEPLVGNLIENDTLGADQQGGLIRALKVGEVTYTLVEDGQGGYSVEPADAEGLVSFENGVLTVKTELGTFEVRMVEAEEGAEGDLSELGDYRFTPEEQIDHTASAGKIEIGGDALWSAGDSGLEVTVFQKNDAGCYEALDRDRLTLKETEGHLGLGVSGGIVDGEIAHGGEGKKPLEYLQIGQEGGAFTQAKIEIGAFFPEGQYHDSADELLYWQAVDANGNVLASGWASADAAGPDGLLTLIVEAGGQPFSYVQIFPKDNGGADGANSDFSLVGAEFFENTPKLEEQLEYTYEDGDGDQSSAVIDICVKDGKPEITVKALSEKTYESFLPGIGSNADDLSGNWGEKLQIAIKTKAIGGIEVDYGNDGPAGVNPLVIDPSQIEALGLTSGGEELTYSLSDDGRSLVATREDGSEVFTLKLMSREEIAEQLRDALYDQIPEGTGPIATALAQAAINLAVKAFVSHLPSTVYAFELKQGLDHLSGDILDLPFEVVATDADGSQSKAELDIRVKDDEPSAADDTISCVIEGGESAVHNLLANDTLGADVAGGFISEITYDGVTYSLVDGAIVTSDGSEASFADGVLSFQTSLGTVEVRMIAAEGGDDAGLPNLGDVRIVAEEGVDHLETLGFAVETGDFGLGDLPAGISVTVQRWNGESYEALTDDKLNVKEVTSPSGDSYFGLGTEKGPVSGEISYDQGEQALERLVVGTTDKTQPGFVTATITLGALFTAEAFGDAGLETASWEAVYIDADGNEIVVASGQVEGTASGLAEFTVESGHAFHFVRVTPDDIGSSGGQNADFNLVGAEFSSAVDKLEDGFTYTYSDGDGDTSSAEVVFCVKDGKPEVLSVSPIKLYEAGLESGTAAGEKAVGLSGTIEVDFGADGPAERPLVFDLDNPVASEDLTVGGAPLRYEISAEGTTLTAFDANGEAVFIASLTSDGESYGYDFTLHKALDHAKHSDLLSIKLNFKAVDADGSASDGVIKVLVKDDQPVICDSSATANKACGCDDKQAPALNALEGATPCAYAEGTLVYNFGADGAGKLWVSLSENEGFKETRFVEDGVTYILGKDSSNGEPAYLLAFDPNGGADGEASYRFWQFKDLPGVDSLDFAVKIKDADGDRDAGNITVEPADLSPPVAEDHTTTATKIVVPPEVLALMDEKGQGVEESEIALFTQFDLSQAPEGHSYQITSAPSYGTLYIHDPANDSLITIPGDADVPADVTPDMRVWWIATKDEVGGDEVPGTPEPVEMSLDLDAFTGGNGNLGTKTVDWGDVTLTGSDDLHFTGGNGFGIRGHGGNNSQIDTDESLTIDFHGPASNVVLEIKPANPGEAVAWTAYDADGNVIDSGTADFTRHGQPGYAEIESDQPFHKLEISPAGKHDAQFALHGVTWEGEGEPIAEPVEPITDPATFEYIVVDDCGCGVSDPATVTIEPGVPQLIIGSNVSNLNLENPLTEGSANVQEGNGALQGSDEVPSILIGDHGGELVQDNGEIRISYVIDNSENSTKESPSPFGSIQSWLHKQNHILKDYVLANPAMAAVLTIQLVVFRDGQAFAKEFKWGDNGDSHFYENGLSASGPNLLDYIDDLHGSGAPDFDPALQAAHDFLEPGTGGTKKLVFLSASEDKDLDDYDFSGVDVTTIGMRDATSSQLELIAGWGNGSGQVIEIGNDPNALNNHHGDFDPQLGDVPEGGTVEAEAGDDWIEIGDGGGLVFGDVINADWMLDDEEIAGEWSEGLKDGDGFDIIYAYLNHEYGDDLTEQHVIDFIVEHRDDFIAASKYDTRGGDDTIVGGAGDDWIIAQGGDDTIYLGGGENRVWGGEGKDTFILTSAEGHSTIEDYGLGENTLEIDIAQFIEVNDGDDLGQLLRDNFDLGTDDEGNQTVVFTGGNDDPSAHKVVATLIGGSLESINESLLYTPSETGEHG